MTKKRSSEGQGGKGNRKYDKTKQLIDVGSSRMIEGCGKGDGEAFFKKSARPRQRDQQIFLKTCDDTNQLHPLGIGNPDQNEMPVSSSSIYSPSMPYYVPGILVSLFFWRHRSILMSYLVHNLPERWWLSWSTNPDGTHGTLSY